MQVGFLVLERRSQSSPFAIDFDRYARTGKLVLYIVFKVLIIARTGKLVLYIYIYIIGKHRAKYENIGKRMKKYVNVGKRLKKYDNVGQRMKKYENR